ncbi:MAG TPA: hypothetical protein VGS41_12365 [Chthonomonadales bacterium]|nr:hypothetical protein [Chthonomonadales bacterium]
MQKIDGALRQDDGGWKAVPAAMNAGGRGVDRKLIRCFVAAALTCLAWAAKADNTADRKAIQAQYDTLALGIEHKNAVQALSITTKDFELILPGPVTLNVKHAKDALAQALASMVSAKCAYRIESITVHGRSAVTAATAIIAYKLKDATGTYGPAGKLHLIKNTENVRDEWVKTPAGWRCKRESDLSEVRTIDGKHAQTFAPQPPGGGKKS